MGDSVNSVVLAKIAVTTGGVGGSLTAIKLRNPPVRF